MSIRCLVAVPSLVLRIAGARPVALVFLVLLAAPSSATVQLTETQELSGVSGSGFGTAIDAVGDVLVVAPESEKAIHLYTRSAVTGLWVAGPTISAAGDGLAPMVPVVATDGTRVFYAVVTTLQPMLEEVELRVAPVASPATYAVVATLDEAPRSLAAAGGVLVAGFVTGLGSIGADSGRIRIYELHGGVWSEEDFFADTGAHQFGFDVATDGSRVVVGAPRDGTNGSMVVYERNLFGWFQRQHYSVPLILQSDAGFGSAVAIDGDCLYVGAPRRNFGFDPAVVDAGYVVVLDWNESLPGFELRSSLQAATPEEDALFGTSVAAAGATLVAGSPGEPGAFNAVQGAAHVFHRTGSDCAPGLHWREAFLLRRAADLTFPPPTGDLGAAVALTPTGALASDPTAPSSVNHAGRVEYYAGTAVLFRDDFESGDPSRWSVAVP